MRKTPLALGVLVLFAGVVVFSRSNYSTSWPKNIILVREGDLPFGDWEISAQLNRSQKIIVVFPPPRQDELIPNGDAIFNVDVVDPTGGNTSFRVAFSPRGDVDMNVTGNEGGLSVPDPIEGIGGTTRYKGLYAVHVHAPEYLAQYYYPPNGTMLLLELYEVVEDRDYPYFSYLPVGIGLMAVGASLSVFAVKSSDRSGRRRRAK